MFLNFVRLSFGTKSSMRNKTPQQQQNPSKIKGLAQLKTLTKTVFRLNEP